MCSHVKELEALEICAVQYGIKRTTVRRIVESNEKYYKVKINEFNRCKVKLKRTMKQDILKALNGDYSKYEMIMQRSRKKDVVKLRREVWQVLRDNEYSDYGIAKFFGMRPSNITCGLIKINENISLDEIKSKIIRFR